jgi:hypothetical protein
MADSTHLIIHRVRGPLAEADYCPLPDGSFLITRLQPLDAGADPVWLLRSTIGAVSDDYGAQLSRA